MKILYIEDSHDLALVTMDFLEKSGHKIVWVDTREKLPASMLDFDLVISDFRVPGGEFVDTKVLCDKESVPLILMSSIFDIESHHNNCLSKPYLPEQLTKMIQQVTKEGAQ